MLAIVCIPASTSAARTSQAQMTILPQVCVVDIVQDGSSQNLQTTPGDCGTLLPNLVAPVPDVPNPGLGPLPFAGRNIPASNSLTSPPDAGVVQTSWSPIASTGQSNPAAVSQALRSVSVLVAGITAVIVATGIAVDFVLFELKYSKVASQWLRRRLARS
jgi:hypothetical protein